MKKVCDFLFAFLAVLVAILTSTFFPVIGFEVDVHKPIGNLMTSFFLPALVVSIAIAVLCTFLKYNVLKKYLTTQVSVPSLFFFITACCSFCAFVLRPTIMMYFS